MYKFKMNYITACDIFVDKESEAGEDMEAMFARSQSTRHYPRTNLGLENIFQRNTPRSKSLGRPKGTRKLLQHSLREGSTTTFRFSFLYGFFEDISQCLVADQYYQFLFQESLLFVSIKHNFYIIRHYYRRIHLQSKNYEEIVLRQVPCSNGIEWP